MARININQLSKTLTDTAARWKPTTEAALTERVYSLGYAPGPTEHSLEAREILARANHQHFMAMAAIAAPPYPAAFDWRNVSGKNFITPVKDQGQCGSCVSFGCVAAVEADVRIKKKNASLKIDLSEAHLFFCHTNVPGGTCGTGWYPDAALTSFQKPGVVDEACYPYTDHDQPCGACSDWQKRVTRIARWHKITSHADMKTWISGHGPLVTCFTVYDDFFAYKSGVYHHVSGGKAGGHCVCCVGYNDAARYWICKNSWAASWGEHGFFRIQYGQVGIDALMWATEL